MEEPLNHCFYKSGGVLMINLRLPRSTRYHRIDRTFTSRCWYWNRGFLDRYLPILIEMKPNIALTSFWCRNDIKITWIPLSDSFLSHALLHWLVLTRLSHSWFSLWVILLTALRKVNVLSPAFTIDMICLMIP